MPLEVQEQWLAQVKEDILEPERRIVDPHHHFFKAGGEFPFYDLDSLWADTDTHNVEQTVFLQCWEGYREEGPEDFKVVGETEWVANIAAQARQSPNRAQIGGIVGSVEMRNGARVRPVLEAHCAASDLFRGIRQCAAWDSHEDVMSMPGIEDANLYDHPGFLEAAAVLEEMNLVLDTYHYHHQLPSLARLAKANPGLTIVLDHLGTPLGVGPYAGQRTEIYEKWRQDIADVAVCPNVVMKLGGLAMPWCGFGFETQTLPPSSNELVAQQADYYHYAIEQFGTERCMFESNFPVDKLALSYGVLWNAFKKMAANYTETEKDNLFRATAARVYKL